MFWKKVSLILVSASTIAYAQEYSVNSQFLTGKVSTYAPALTSWLHGAEASSLFSELGNINGFTDPSLASSVSQEFASAFALAATYTGDGAAWLSQVNTIIGADSDSNSNIVSAAIAGLVTGNDGSGSQQVQTTSAAPAVVAVTTSYNPTSIMSSASIAGSPDMTSLSATTSSAAMVGSSTSGASSSVMSTSAASSTSASASTVPSTKTNGFPQMAPLSSRTMILALGCIIIALL